MKNDAPKKCPKGLLWGAAALVLVIALAVCWVCGLFGGPDPQEAPDPTLNTTAPQVTQAPTEPPLPTVEITVWAPSADQGEDGWLAEMQDRFAAAHPEYEFVWTNEIKGEGDAAGLICGDPANGADVYFFLSSQLNSLVQAGGLTRLEGDFEQQVLRDNGTFMVDSVTHTDGGLYAFPTTGSTWFMYYNKDVFTAEDVTSLDAMLEKGKVCLPLDASWSAGCFFLGTGCTAFGENGRDAAAGIQFGGENGYRAAKKMVELAANSNVICGGMDPDKLIQGEAGAIFAGAWVADALEEALGDQLGVAALPKFTADGVEYQMCALSASSCVGVNPGTGADGDKQALCMEFAAFLASEESQLERYLLRGVAPAHVALRQNETVAADPVAVAEIDTIATAAALQSSQPGMSRYWGPMSEFVKGVTSGQTTLDNYAAAVDEMAAAMRAEDPAAE